MLPTRLQQVFYDPIAHKLLGEQKNGRFEIVDTNPQTAELPAGQEFFLLQPSLYQDHFIDIDVPSGKHYLFYIADSDIPDYQADVNSTFTVTNIGQGTLEFVSVTYTTAATVSSAVGNQLNPNGQAVLRYRGNDSWHATGDNTTTNAQIYDVDIQVVPGPPSYNNYGLTAPGGSVVVAPTLNLMINQELVFNVNIAGHPLWIKTSQGVGAGVADPDGVLVKNHGVQTGQIRARFTKAGTYYYQCQYHNAMHGEIVVS